MAVNSAERAQIIAQITQIDLQIAAANTAYLKSLSTDIESYRFDSGQGSQSVKRRDPAKISSELNALSILRQSLIERLNGSSVVNLRLNRRGGY